MASPTIEPPKSVPNPPPDLGSPARASRPRFEPVDHEEFHLLIADLQDDVSKSRLREAVWISIIFHLLLLFTIKQLPKWLPVRSVTLLTPEQIAERQKSQELIFSEQPKDLQKVTEKPQSNKISDKDRIATSRQPQIDKKTMERLLNNRREGAPGMGPQQPFTPPQPQVQPQQQPQQMAEARPPQNTNPNALPEPQQPKPLNRDIFKTQSNSSAVQQAVRDAARSRGGISGQLGGGPGAPGNVRMGDIDILSDTQGVDFGPYMERVIQAIRTNWYAIIPESARPPILKQGNVYIQFVIGKDGKVSGMRLEGPSGDISLDRAAWGGITGSNPFPQLPTQFSGPYLALRIKFMYNPDKSQIR